MNHTPQIGNYVCASIDLIGTKGKIDKEEFVLCVDKLFTYLKTSSDFEEHGQHIRVFSDNFVIAMKVQDDDDFARAAKGVILMTSTIQSNAIFSTECLVRGGIAYGQLLAGESIILGPALSRAYEIESKEAIYPRVVIDENIVDMLNSSIDYADPYDTAKWTTEKMLDRDFDGRMYVKNDFYCFTITDDFLSAHPEYRATTSALVKIFNKMVADANGDQYDLQKYVWLAKNVNKELKEVNETKRLSVPPLYCFISDY